MSTTVTLKTALADSNNIPDDTSIHGHTNKTALDKISEDSGNPTWDDDPWPADDTASAIHEATAKTTPADADTVGLIDSEASNVLKKLSWSNIKATLKNYFDNLYADRKVQFGTEITGDADITATNHKFKTTDVNKSTAVTLTLKKNLFVVGEWFVLVQTGDGQFTLNGESGVTVPAWKKSAGKGFEMYVYCVDATTDANVFRIVGGVE
jgi:hypothetical protein